MILDICNNIIVCGTYQFAHIRRSSALPNKLTCKVFASVYFVTNLAKILHFIVID